jgi:tRNA pseudouridine13 synthase
LLPGTRRHNLIYVNGLSAVEQDDSVQVSFALSAGSYATILLQEVMKAAGIDSCDES